MGWKGGKESSGQAKEAGQSRGTSSLLHVPQPHSAPVTRATICPATLCPSAAMGPKSPPGSIQARQPLQASPPCPLVDLPRTHGWTVNQAFWGRIPQNKKHIQ